MQRQKRAGTPSLQTKSARHRTAASPIVAQPRDASHYTAMRRHEDDLRRNFKAGLYLGLAIGLVVMVLIMWLWAVPTVDGCVENMKQMQEQMLQSSVVMA